MNFSSLLPQRDLSDIRTLVALHDEAVVLDCTGCARNAFHPMGWSDTSVSNGRSAPHRDLSRYLSSDERSNDR